ncbi:MAG: hypothetical protein AAF915_18895 [Cyanobacteria bacterium P01_D01_bin.50]
MTSTVSLFRVNYFDVWKRQAPVQQILQIQLMMSKRRVTLSHRLAVSVSQYIRKC